MKSFFYNKFCNEAYLAYLLNNIYNKIYKQINICNQIKLNDITNAAN